MYTMDVDTLAEIQNQRYREFRANVEQLRLLRTQQGDNTARSTATPVRKQNPLAALQQMVMMALQTHSRALPPR